MLLGATGGIGCSTRNVEDRIINRYGLDVHLLSEKKLFGSAIDRGYAHPSDIPVERLEIILGSLQIDRRVRANSVRGPAIPAEILGPVSQGLAEAFRRADSSQQIAVSAQRKQRQKGIFHRKFLTTFIAFMEGDELVLHLSRSDWPVDENRKGGLPRPHVNDPQGEFRVVTNEFIRQSGRTGVAVEWRSDVFGTFAAASAARTAPVATGAGGAATAGAGGTTVLMAEPEEELTELEPLTNEQLQSLSPADLRDLADLEDARTASRITENEYRRQRRTILDAAAS
ncbi:MAG: hypothetical protein OEV20_08585, partial [Actinomycetota bacterium]|nr:hypothetical protein [Actinomycetota bacterium]